MEAGKLDRTIVIERPFVTLDDFGGQVTTWSPIATAWAAVMPVSDGERWRAGEVAAHITHRFQMRWGASLIVEVTDRIIYEGRTYEISGVKEIGRREGQEITAAARAE